MKKLVTLCAVVFLFGLCLANPVVPHPLHRIWFDSSGDCFMELSGEFPIGNIHYIGFSTGGEIYTLPSSVEVNQLPFTFNASQTLPELNLWVWETALQVYNSYGNTLFVSWGEGDDVDFRPLEEGQSAVLINHGEGYWDMSGWAKDIGHGENAYYPQMSSMLQVTAQYSDGTPAANVSVFANSIYGLIGYTGADGVFSMPAYAVKVRIFLKDPESGETLYNQLHFIEPDSVHEINLTLSGTGVSDDQMIPAAGILELRPNVIRLSESRRLQISYSKEATPGAMLSIFDLRGRQVLSASFNDEMSLELPAMSNGIYFVKLHREGHLLGLKRLIVYN